MMNMLEIPPIRCSHISGDESQFFPNNNNSWCCRALQISRLISQSFPHKCIISCMFFTSVLPGCSITESRNAISPSVTEHLEHVQNIHADRLGLWGNTWVYIRRFFINSLFLVVLMDEHSDRKMTSGRISLCQSFYGRSEKY